VRNEIQLLGVRGCLHEMKRANFEMFFRQSKREEGEYREYLTDEQRRVAKKQPKSRRFLSCRHPLIQSVKSNGKNFSSTRKISSTLLTSKKICDIMAVTQTLERANDTFYQPKFIFRLFLLLLFYRVKAICVAQKGV